MDRRLRNFRKWTFMKTWIVTFLLVASCGGSKWTPEDEQSAQDIANGALSLEAVCDRDGGPCPGAAVRAMERGTYCAAGAMLYRHSAHVPEAGVRCAR